MGKDPAMLFYPNDYIGGTMGMTFEQKGAYMELLMLQFNRGHMTSHMIGQTVGQLWGQIEDKFVKDADGLWYNKRIDEEKLKRQNYVSSRLNNKLGVNQYTKKKKKKSGHMTGHMENENEDVNKDKKHKYGEYKNVLLTDKDLEFLKNKFPKLWKDKIENLSEGLQNKGYVYKDHKLTIVQWDRRDKEKNPQPEPRKKVNHYVYQCPVCQKEFKHREKSNDTFPHECDNEECQELLMNNQMRGHYLKFKEAVYK